VKTLVGYTARDKRVGLTLSELATVVQVAMRADADPDALVRVQVGLRGQVKEISVQGPDVPTHP
jgi:hypothetical protein